MAGADARVEAQHGDAAEVMLRPRPDERLEAEEELVGRARLRQLDGRLELLERRGVRGKDAGNEPRHRHAAARVGELARAVRAARLVATLLVEG